MTLVQSYTIKLFCLEITERLEAFDIDYQCSSEFTGSAGKKWIRNNGETVAMPLFLQNLSKPYILLLFIHNLATHHLIIGVQKRLRISGKVHFNNLPSGNRSPSFQLVVASDFGNVTLWL